MTDLYPDVSLGDRRVVRGLVYEVVGFDPFNGEIRLRRLVRRQTYSRRAEVPELWVPAGEWKRVGS
jgi:hypothetical protein